MTPVTDIADMTDKQRQLRNGLYQSMGGLYNARYAVPPLSDEFDKIVKLQTDLQGFISELESKKWQVK